MQDTHFALWAPKGASPDIRAKFQDGVRTAMAKSGLAERFREMGATAQFSGPKEVTRITEREAQNFNLAIETANVKFSR